MEETFKLFFYHCDVCLERTEYANANKIEHFDRAPVANV